jgi:hypothetical protein
MRPARGVLVSFRTPSRSRKSPYHAHLSTPFHLPCERVFIQCHLENGLSPLFLTARAAVMSPVRAGPNQISVCPSPRATVFVITIGYQ